MTFLVEKDLVNENVESHYCLLKSLWFGLYPRGKHTNSSSSGFEHVFVVENKRNKLVGLHNWLYFAEMEQSGDLNYKGWSNVVDLGDVSKTIMEIQLGMVKERFSVY